MRVTIHKRNNSPVTPKVSIILLDWSVRERFQALDWLAGQSVPRQDYELIWIELYGRVMPEALQQADVVITCDQKRPYHKHLGYNVGLLAARGQIITICDSDAVFPREFIASILDTFQPRGARDPIPLVLMHYEWRTAAHYPDNLSDLDQLARYEWYPLWPNVGACMSVRTADAFRLGGFDEHPSFRGYMCGPYDLGWRMVNAGIRELWHDPSVALWHFAHPDPLATSGAKFSFKLWREIAHPHLDGHALTAVEAFSSGRLLPLDENSQVHGLRMAQRQIGTPFEEQYAALSPDSFSRKAQFRLQLSHLVSDQPYFKALYRMLGLARLRAWLGRQEAMEPLPFSAMPRLVRTGYKGYNFVHYQTRLYAVSQALGHVDMTQLDDETLDEYQARGRCFVTDSIVAAKRWVDARARWWRW